MVDDSIICMHVIWTVLLRAATQLLSEMNEQISKILIT